MNPLEKRLILSLYLEPRSLLVLQVCLTKTKHFPHSFIISMAIFLNLSKVQMLFPVFVRLRRLERII